MAEKKESAEATVRTIRRVMRRKDPAEERVQTVQEGLWGEVQTHEFEPTGTIDR